MAHLTLGVAYSYKPRAIVSLGLKFMLDRACYTAQVNIVQRARDSEYNIDAKLVFVG